ncbi:MAG: class I SAM-dependent methyltransferase [Negativicutes bacterium]|nr:class I SAM-dependent methyltransferase [Negativicutes bacterium]
MNYFQELAAKYDAWFATPHGRYVFCHEREKIMELLDIKPGIYTLDIGCGTGIYTNELCQAGARVVGVDISPEMLAIAADKNRQHGDTVSFLAADAAALPFADESFDLVTSISAMEFYEKPRESLQEMYRVLRPGGHMLVATLNSLSPWSLQRRIKSLLKRTIFTPARFYSIYAVRDFLAPHPITAWRGCIFVPPFAPAGLINNPDHFERWCQRHIPSLGTFIVARVDKPEKR